MSKRAHAALLLLALATGVFTSLGVACSGAIAGVRSSNSTADAYNAVVAHGDPLFYRRDRLTWCIARIEMHRAPLIFEDNHLWMRMGAWGVELDGAHLARVPSQLHPPPPNADARNEYQVGWPAPCLWAATDEAGDSDITKMLPNQHVVQVWPLGPLQPGDWGAMFPFHRDSSSSARYIPTGLLPTGLALDTLAFAPAWYLLLAGPPLLRRHLRLRRHHCPRCNYNLASLPPNSPCPECGAKVPRASSP